VVFSGTDAEYARVVAVIDHLKPGGMATNLAGKASLPLIAGILAKASLVISVNTGIMHLAAAVKALLVAINGPTSVIRWGAVSQYSVTVTPIDMSCAPCLNLGYEYKCSENKCMKTISPQAVLDAAKMLTE
jgi:heptosyltransferase I